jgi:hypothetical protein
MGLRLSRDAVLSRRRRTWTVTYFAPDDEQEQKPENEIEAREPEQRKKRVPRADAAAIAFERSEQAVN